MARVDHIGELIWGEGGITEECDFVDTPEVRAAVALGLISFPISRLPDGSTRLIFSLAFNTQADELQEGEGGETVFFLPDGSVDIHAFEKSVDIEEAWERLRLPLYLRQQLHLLALGLALEVIYAWTWWGDGSTDVTIRVNGIRQPLQDPDLFLHTLSWWFSAPSPEDGKLTRLAKRPPKDRFPEPADGIEPGEETHQRHPRVIYLAAGAVEMTEDDRFHINQCPSCQSQWERTQSNEALLQAVRTQLAEANITNSTENTTT